MSLHVQTKGLKTWATKSIVHDADTLDAFEAMTKNGFLEEDELTAAHENETIAGVQDVD